MLDVEFFKSVSRLPSRNSGNGRCFRSALVKCASRQILLSGASAIFVSAVANQLKQVARFREHRFDLRFILPVSCKTEHARVVVEMLRDSETGADDDTRNGWTLEDIAHAC